MNTQEFVSRYLVERKNTTSSKWDGLKSKFGEDNLLPLWIADMEFATCDEIVNALVERSQHGVFGYSFVPDEYYEIFSDWHEKRYNFPVKRECLRFSTGCVTGIAWMIHAFTKPGDSCMILTPVYYPFHNVVTNNNRKLVKVPLIYDNGYFTMDYDAIEKAIIDNNVKMFIQCSPHNPVGRVWSEMELDRVLSICQKHEVLVTSDEIHQDLVIGEKKFIPSAVVANGKYKDIILTLSSATKTFNLATLLHSHIIISNEDLMKEYDKFASGLNRTEVSIMGMIATQAGYAHGEKWLNGLLNVIRDNYKYLKEKLSSELPNAVTCCLEGTYLVMLDLRKCLDPMKTQDIIQGKCGLAVDYGEWFGDGYEGFIRMNLATDPAIVHEAVERLINVLR